MKDDVLIIGSGVAAFQLVTSLSTDLNVRILTKSNIRTANSYLAQGGIAAAIGPGDNPAKHYADTLEAGRYHNKDDAVRTIVDEAPSLIAHHGAIFDKDPSGQWHLGLEGAHSEKRIVHSGGDATGKHVMEHLIDHLTENIIIEENVFVYELILDHEQKRCIGVKAKNENHSIKFYYADFIIIATGGCGQIYSFTSNAPTVTGDGIAMAYLAGAEIADMEFVQFHPTLLYKDGETKGLISEAVRGEGAILVTEDGTAIMEGVHPLQDLAPRHIVSQTLLNYIENGHTVYLDIRHVQDFETKFPSISALCQTNGIDLAEGRIPVVPGSHFIMGGIKTDLVGRSSLEGLFAIGEAACTGLHGANRLASNSLLEALYQGKKLSQWILQSKKGTQITNNPEIDRPSMVPKACPKAYLPDVQILKDTMMKRVGIICTKEQLLLQKNWLQQFNVNDLTNLDSMPSQDIQVLFMLINAYLITEAALTRTESRGAHFRSDYPYEDDEKWGQKVIIQKRRGNGEMNDEQSEIAFAT